MGIVSILRPRLHQARLMKAARQLELAAALEPIDPAFRRLFRDGAIERLAAALPLPEEQIYGDATDGELNEALYPFRSRGLRAAEDAGAAHLVDNCALPGALWGLEVDDPAWSAALGTIDVAMLVCIFDLDGQPVTPAMRAAHRVVIDIAGLPA